MSEKNNLRLADGYESVKPYMDVALGVKEHLPKREAPIVVMFFDKEKRKNGRPVNAITSKLSDAEKAWCRDVLRSPLFDELNNDTYVGDPQWGFGDYNQLHDGEDGFAIKIHFPTWQLMSDRERSALIDHELCHCLVEHDEMGGIVVSLVAHDIEEFGAVLARNGDVWGELKKVNKAIDDFESNLFDGAKGEEVGAKG